jgi:hypothetical protein
MSADDQYGGPGRTRTCNQTVMSGEGSQENPENIDEQGDVQLSLFTFGCGEALV